MAATFSAGSSFIIILAVFVFNANSQPLTSDFYATSCPDLGTVVRDAMREGVTQDPRLPASIIRLFFHDCFVNGCDGSILLDDTPTIKGEKKAGPNRASARGFEVIDTIKTRVEAACAATVSCADILALAARDAVALAGGNTFAVLLGRRDARTASFRGANSDLPGPGDDLPALISAFAAKGLTASDMVVLSGAHTIGLAKCVNFRNRLYGEQNIDPRFAANLHRICPASPGDGDVNLTVLDVQTPVRFDNSYYSNLVSRRGLLHSDQVLFNNGSLDAAVTFYSSNVTAFQHDFAEAMIKMGSISPLTGTDGEVRRNCRFPN